MQSLLMYWYRGGSTLIQKLLQVTHSRPKSVGNWIPSRNCRFVSTSPPNLCPFEDTVPLRKGPIDVPFNRFLWRSHVGDPVVYPPRLVDHIGEDGRVIMLCRDGRNQIESSRNCFSGMSEEGIQHKQSEDFFRNAVEGFKRRASFFLSVQKDLEDRALLIKMEDLVFDPMDTILKVYKFVDIPPNLKDLKRKISLLPTHGKKQYLRHSSFDSIDGFTKRWKSWTSEERNIFDGLAGEELVGLGYEL